MQARRSRVVRRTEAPEPHARAVAAAFSSCASFVMATLAAILSVVAPASASASPDVGAGWRCPPCGCGADDVIHDAPGECTACGMPLLRAGDIKRVGILIFEGVELLDFAGPVEAFVASHAFEVLTVGETTETVMSLGVVGITPQHSIESCPPLDLILVPGGSIDAVTESETLMAWLGEQAAACDHVLSVCNGAFVLGELGLLDGIAATTHHGATEGLQARFPTARVEKDVRFVDSSRVITSAGVSAGIDMALHVVSRKVGHETALGAARYMQYEWSDASTTEGAERAER